MRKLIYAVVAVLLIGFVVEAVATIATNAGLYNIYLKVDNGFSELDQYSSKRFDQTTAAFNAFTLTVGVNTNKIAVPDVATAGVSIFANLGTQTVYWSSSDSATAVGKILTNEVAGPFRLATTNISFWVVPGGGGTTMVKGKVYAE